MSVPLDEVTTISPDVIAQVRGDVELREKLRHASMSQLPESRR